MIPLIALGLGVAASAGGAYMASKKNQQARDEEKRSYNDAVTRLDMWRNQDPLSMVGNRSLLKLRDQQREENLDAMQNRAVAGGATMENQLAAMKNENRTDSELQSRLLQNEDARRMALDQQRLGLDMQHSANVQASYLADAQNWNQWGANTAGAFADFGATGLYAQSRGLTDRALLGWKR